MEWFPEKFLVLLNKDLRVWYEAYNLLTDLSPPKHYEPFMLYNEYDGLGGRAGRILWVGRPHGQVLNIINKTLNYQFFS